MEEMISVKCSIVPYERSGRETYFKRNVKISNQHEACAFGIIFKNLKIKIIFMTFH